MTDLTEEEREELKSLTERAREAAKNLTEGDDL